MIEKMKFLSLTGPKEDIDRVADLYLSKYEIHLEEALVELKSRKGLTPYVQANPYKDTLRLAEEYVTMLPENAKREGADLTPEEAVACVEAAEKNLKEEAKKKEELLKKLRQVSAYAEKIEPFQDLPVDINTLMNFRMLFFRFGRMPRDYFEKFDSVIYAEPDTLFCQSKADSHYVWGLYFCAKENLTRIDAMYTSMHFEPIFIPNVYEGTPNAAYNNLIKQKEELEAQIGECDKNMETYLAQHEKEIFGARNKLAVLSGNFDIRKMAACTSKDFDTFYILCGWMSVKDAEALQKDCEADGNVNCYIEDNNEVMDHKEPPTKLKNPKLFQPFEMFIKMYGLPGYREFDPTIYLAITYSIIFGIMFGDAGQGLCFVIGGFLIYSIKKTPLAAIMGTAGIFSTIFGLIYNSFFGFEGFFPWPALIRPMEDMTKLPLLGSMNTVFVLAIALGMFMILLNIVLGIVNAVRHKDVENIFFSQNAIAGIIFYGSVVALIFLLMSGKGSLKGLVILLIILMVVGLVIILLKELLTNMVKKKTPVIEGSKGMFFVQSFFETFEVVLSFLSNTLSYVRVGAYAVSHVAMMQVVMLLAGAQHGGSGNMVIIIIGNIFVAAMEALMVAIQVLRLEYYEMFSRFYKGNGREFRPFAPKAVKAGK